MTHLFGRKPHTHVKGLSKGSKSVSQCVSQNVIHMSSKVMSWNVKHEIIQNHENKWIRRWSKSGSKMSTPNINKTAINVKKGPKKGVQKWAPFEQKGPSQRLNGFQKWTQNWKTPIFDRFCQKVGTHFWGSKYQWGLIKHVSGKTRKRAILGPLKWSLLSKNRMWVWSKK